MTRDLLQPALKGRDTTVNNPLTPQHKYLSLAIKSLIH